MTHVANKTFEINKICRACLNNKDCLEPICNSYLKELFIVLTNLEINENDGLPSNLCLNCVERLNICYSFREQCIKNDVILKESQKIKSEHLETGDTSTTGNENELPISHFLEISYTDKCDNGQMRPMTQNVFKTATLDIKEETSNCDLIKDNSRYEKLHHKSNKKDSKEQEHNNMIGRGLRKSKRKLKYSCNYCEKKFDISNSLKMHILDEHTAFEKSLDDTRSPESPKPKQKQVGKKKNPSQNCNLNLSCPSCSQTFKKAERLEAHFREHLGQKPEVCKECNGEFANRKALKRHMLKHTGVRNHVCSECGKCFAYLQVLKMHEKIHTGIRAFICDVCGNSFLTNNNLKLHYANKHSDERPFCCEICPLTFKNSSVLKMHMFRHSGVKNFICTLCGHRTATKGELTAHTKTHSQEKPFACTTCSKKYKTSKELVIHNRMHTGERPYLCDLCPMSFTMLKILKNHRMTHTGEKPFACNVCQRAFTQKVTLKTHMKTHN